jgi:hypothetical protein
MIAMSFFKRYSKASRADSNVVEVAGQELAGEIQRERLPEIELSLVRYLKEFLAVADVIRQYVQVVAEPGMTIELARLLAQKGPCSLPSPAHTNSKAPSMSFKLTGTVILANEG